MDQKDMLAGIQKMQAMVAPWHQSLKNPKTSQENTLERLIQIYQQSKYGKEHHSETISTYADYQQFFPVRTYEEYKPLIQRVMEGETSLLLNEEPI
jgi:hypothetical protein